MAAGAVAGKRGRRPRWLSSPSKGAEDATRAQRLLRPCDWLVAGEGFEPPTFGL